MEYLVTSAEMKRCDGNTIEHFGMPSMVLMERRRWPVRKN